MLYFVNNDFGLPSLFPVSFSDAALFQHCRLRPLPLSAAHAQLLFLTVEYKGEVFSFFKFSSFFVVCMFDNVLNVFTVKLIFVSNVSVNKPV